MNTALKFYLALVSIFLIAATYPHYTEAYAGAVRGAARLLMGESNAMRGASRSSSYAREIRSSYYATEMRSIPPLTRSGGAVDSWSRSVVPKVKSSVAFKDIADRYARENEISLAEAEEQLLLDGTLYAYSKDSSLKEQGADEFLAARLLSEIEKDVRSELTSRRKSTQDADFIAVAAWMKLDNAAFDPERGKRAALQRTVVKHAVYDYLKANSGFGTLRIETEDGRRIPFTEDSASDFNLYKFFDGVVESNEVSSEIEQCVQTAISTLPKISKQMAYDLIDGYSMVSVARRAGVARQSAYTYRNKIRKSIEHCFD